MAGARGERLGHWGIRETEAFERSSGVRLMGRAPGSQRVAGARFEGQRAQLLGALRKLELWKNRDPELLDA